MARSLVTYYNSIARIYTDTYLKMDFYRTLYRKLGEVVDKYIKPGMEILDVGAGTGFWSIYMRSRGARVVSLDISAKSLELCRCDDRVNGDAVFLPFRSGSFDVVTAFGSVYNHVSALDVALASARRVLRKGGLFIADIDNAVCLDMLYEYLMYQGLDKFRDALVRGVVRGVWESAHGEVPFTYYSYFYVRAALKKAGFKVVEARPIYLLPLFPTRLLQRRLRLRWLERLDVLRRLAPFATNVVYIAVKV
jgi:Methylase involved in ubiquinone/menaquinone biosynthesis